MRPGAPAIAAETGPRRGTHARTCRVVWRRRFDLDRLHGAAVLALVTCVPDGAKVRPHSWLPNLQRIACIKPMAVLLEGWRRSHRALSRVQFESPVFVGIQPTGQRGPPAFGP